MEADLPILPGVVIPGAELAFTASRASGPGGQHVNKTSSRVILRWDVRASVALDDRQRARVCEKLRSRLTRDGVLQVAAESERSQHRNRQLARQRLAALVRGALSRRKRRVRTKIPRSVHRRRIEGKRRRGQVKRLRKKPAET